MFWAHGSQTFYLELQDHFSQSGWASHDSQCSTTVVVKPPAPCPKAEKDHNRCPRRCSQALAFLIISCGPAHTQPPASQRHLQPQMPLSYIYSIFIFFSTAGRGTLYLAPCPKSVFSHALYPPSPLTSQIHHHPSLLAPPPETRLGILFLWAFTSSAMIWKKEPLHRITSCTNIVHTLLILSSISRGLVDGHFHKLKNKQILRQSQSPRAGWRVHSHYRHWFLPAKSFQSRREIGKRKKVHCALLTSSRLFNWCVGEGSFLKSGWRIAHILQ